MNRREDEENPAHQKSLDFGLGSRWRLETTTAGGALEPFPSSFLMPLLLRATAATGRLLLLPLSLSLKRARLLHVLHMFVHIHLLCPWMICSVV